MKKLSTTKILSRKTSLLILLIFIFIINTSHLLLAFQPDDAYELDPFEIQSYLSELSKDKTKNEKEILKFILILKNNIQDEEEYKEFVSKNKTVRKVAK